MDSAAFLRQFSVDRRNTDSIKWDGLQGVFGREDLLPLWVADMDFKTCPEIIEAVVKRAEHGAFGYSAVPDSFHEAFAAWEKQYGYIPRKEELRYSAGVVTMLNRLVNCFTKPQDAVLILTPVYYPFRLAIENNGRAAVQCDLVESKDRFTIDFDAVERAVAEHPVRMAILCSPHNPVGRVWTREELSGLLRIFGKYGVLTVSDEIHQDFHFGAHEQTCLLGLLNDLAAKGERMPNGIAVTAPSKTFNLASLGFSVTMIPDGTLRRRYDDYLLTLGFPGVDVLATTAAEAGYRCGKDWLSGVKAVICENFLHIRERFQAECPALRVFDLEGTYLPFIDLRSAVDVKAHPETVRLGTSETNAAMVDLVQHKARLAVDYGEWFGKGFAGFIRLNLATTPETIDEAVTRLILAVKS